MQRIVLCILVGCVLMSTGCESIRKMFRRKEAAPPMLAAPNPSLEQIISVVNRNAQMIRNFHTEVASVYVPGVVLPLQSTIVFERKKRIRIQGSLSSWGSKEFDFGSNDVQFWFWMRLLQGEMYYCRHDLFAQCPVRSAVPLDPDWLLDALGLAEFSPTDRHIGPSRLADGNWEIVSQCQTSSGQFTKRTVIDAKIGWIIRQEMYSPQNVLLASAVATDLRYDKTAGIYYPKRVEMQCQGTNGKITIDMGTPIFNQDAAAPAGTFDMPVFDGYRAVDLCSPEFLKGRGMLLPAQTSWTPEQLNRQPPAAQAAIKTEIRR